jgi:tRNA isopentenyl-2-thiomethyl-A-37 hydroxylase MiaE
LGAITDFAAYINAATERLNKLVSYLPESKDQLAKVAMRIKAEHDRTMKILLAETLTSVEGKGGGFGGEPPRWGTGGF